MSFSDKVEPFNQTVLSPYVEFDSPVPSGCLEKVSLVLKDPSPEYVSARCVVPQLMANIISHGLHNHLSVILKQTSAALVSIISDVNATKSEGRVIGMAFTILAKTACSALEGSKLDLLVSHGITPTQMIQTTLDIIKRPDCTFSCYVAGIDLLAALPLSNSAQRRMLLAHQSTYRLLLASLWCTDRIVRFDALEVLLNTKDSAKGPKGDESAGFPIEPYKEALRLAGQAPLNISRESTAVTMLKDLNGFHSAIQGAASNQDYYNTGLKLYPIIMTSAFYPLRYRLHKTRVPWSSGVTVLPHCTKAIKDRGIPAEEKIADALLLRHAAMTSLVL
jgi:hypothetical protein